jgi:hypothetical protein
VFVGKIVNVAAEENVLSKNGKVDPMKLNALLPTKRHSAGNNIC